MRGCSSPQGARMNARNLAGLALLYTAATGCGHSAMSGDDAGSTDLSFGDLSIGNHAGDMSHPCVPAGTFALGGARSYPAGKHPEWVAAGDLDGDGKIDLAVADSEVGINVLINDGGGVFRAPM